MGVIGLKLNNRLHLQTFIVMFVSSVNNKRKNLGRLFLKAR